MISARLETLLKIPPSEQGRTGLLFLFAFGMSGAYVCARSEGDAAFLARVGVARLPAMILVAASAVAIVTAVYSRLVASMSLRKVILWTHILLGASTLALGFLINSGNRSDAIPESLYLLAELRGAIGSIQFATLLNDMFRRSAPAAVSGVAGAGSTLAGILLGGAIGLLAASLGATTVLFVIPVLDLMAGIVALRCPGRQRDTGDENDSEGDSEGHSTPSRPLQVLRTSPLVRYVALMVCLKSIVVLMIEFKWKASAGRHFTSEDDLAGFFGVFYAGLFLLTGMLQLFGTARFLTRAGIRTGLAIFPGCLAAVLVGTLLSSGTAMFWWLTAARGCDTIRRGVTDPTLNILYWPLKPELRRQVIALTGGWIKPLAEAMTALLLIPLAASLTDRWLAIIILSLSLLWLGVIYRGRLSGTKQPGLGESPSRD
ncbi:MAG: hypothetical protein O2820_23570 [Planctomycetota bacterium]|nr:hypothetical protein [Planctomycetota bacterium]MDA1252195.1 hypothetical protein [Planctomycetota bacterium]